MSESVFAEVILLFANILRCDFLGGEVIQRGNEMKVKTWMRFACAIIVTSIVATGMPLSVSASLTNDFIKESEASKSQAEQNKTNLKNGLTNVQTLLKSLESAKGDLQEYITELDTNLNIITANLEYLEERIAVKKDEVEKTQAELEEARATAQNQYITMKRRIRFMYEKGESSNLEMLLSSKSFTDFLNKAEFIQRVSEYDRKMLNEYIATQAKIAQTNDMLMAEQAELVEAEEALKQEQDAMETLISSKEQEINLYEADISNKEAAIKEYQAEIAAQDAIIKELEAAILAEKKRLLEENRSAINYDGGKFAWPAPKYIRVSDEYGNRIHPILGVQQFHNGVDLAAPSGSPILAAYDGEVVAADYSSTMGNYIMIDHGDGLVTIYMHASSLGVSKGTMVARGEQIGCVGSTGRSTGPHLHFSVRENGSYVSPWKYIG